MDNLKNILELILFGIILNKSFILVWLFNFVALVIIKYKYIKK